MGQPNSSRVAPAAKRGSLTNPTPPTALPASAQSAPDYAAHWANAARMISF